MNNFKTAAISENIIRSTDCINFESTSFSALHCASAEGHPEIVDLLLTSDSNPSYVDARDSNGCTALFYSIAEGHLECSRLLLGPGRALVDEQDRKLRSPSHYACTRGELASLKLLAHSGANIDLENQRGDLAVHEAVQSKSIGEKFASF